MKTLITGHRLFKLQDYDIDWIKDAIGHSIIDIKMSCGYAGMASGVDLWFCEKCIELHIPYIACIPFTEQQELVEKAEQDTRLSLIDRACNVKNVRNSWMVEACEQGIVVWDGNKGGTHNVVQQMVEKKRRFIWINPVSEKIWECF